MIFPCRNWLSIFSLRWLYRLLALLCYYKDLQLCAKSSSKTQIVDIFLPFIMFFFLFVEISGYIGKPTYLIIYHFRFGLFILILIFICRISYILCRNFPMQKFCFLTWFHYYNNSHRQYSWKLQYFVAWKQPFADVLQNRCS